MAPSDQIPANSDASDHWANQHSFWGNFKRKLKKPRFAVEVGAFFVLVVYALATLYQSCKMRETTEASIDSVRAWIVADSFAYRSLDSPIIITLKNIGKSPAIQVWNTKIEVKFVQDGSAPNFSDCDLKMNRPSYAETAALATDDTRIIHPEKALKLTPDQVAIFDKEDGSLYVHTCVYYTYLAGHGDGFTDICGRITVGAYGTSCSQEMK